MDVEKEQLLWRKVVLTTGFVFRNVGQQTHNTLDNNPKIVINHSDHSENLKSRLSCVYLISYHFRSQYAHVRRAVIYSGSISSPNEPPDLKFYCSRRNHGD
jgi:hypothetical protein